VLLAYDLSPASERAAALIGGTDWPVGTIVRVVTSPIGIAALSSFATPSEARARIAAARETIAVAHARIADELRSTGLTVEAAVIHGRPERAIRADAAHARADLIVIGARDQGPLSAAMLGSVSRALVDAAPCSVLVARTSAVSRILLATDGSAAANLATEMISTWPLFPTARTLVVGVGDAPAAEHRPVLDSAARHAAGFGTSPDRRVSLDDVVGSAARALATRTGDVETQVRAGDPAGEIVSAAEGWAADLIALGANGEPLLRRVILGSVARSVLNRVRSSILVARPSEGGGTS
jgi:nucleotide-binding universal stress UspA family protein